MGNQALVYTFWATSILLIGVGLIIYFIANRIPPNPFLGFRIGYAYVSRRVWVKLNRISGIVVALIGVLVLVESLFFGKVLALLLMPAQLVVATVILVECAEKLAEKELINTPGGRETEIKPIQPFKPNILHIIIPLVMLGVLVGYAITLYPQLPDKVAVHFDINDRPDRYGSKTEVLVVLLISSLIVYTLLFFFMYLGVKKPVAFYKPRLRSSTIRRIVYTLYTLLVLVVVMISFSMIDLLHYNVYGTHILPLNLVITPMFILIIGLVVYIIDSKNCSRSRTSYHIIKTLVAQ